MRVLHVIPSVSLVRGGPSQAILELVRAVRLVGCDAEILTTNDDGPGVLDVPLGELIIYRDAPTRFFSRLSPRVRAVREFAFSASLARWLEEHVCDYDIVHVHALFSHAPNVAMRASRRHGIPYINRPSGLLCRWSLEQSRLRKRIFLSLFDRANLNGAAALEFTAEQEKDEASELGLVSRSFVMPYGVHVPQLISDSRSLVRQRLGIPLDRPMILFLSRLHPKKAVHHLLDALALLADESFSVVIAGSGTKEYESRLRRQVASGRLLGRVVFAGFVTGEYKQMLLQAADLFVLPSHSESFAIAVMEALAAGVPVVTTCGVPLAALVSKFDLGWICEPETMSLKGTVASALAALRDSVKSESRRQRSRELIARNCSWEGIAARTQAVYRAIIHRDPIPSFELRSMNM